MLKIAHIINPVVVKKSSDLFIAQPITFETMKIAREFARQYGVEVELYSAQYPEDRAIVPEVFIQTPDLERSILDVHNFQSQRKLPLIKDILDRLDRASDADYFIYTNVDIAVMPNFYVAVAKSIEQGNDTLVINRRTISKTYSRVEDIPLMYAELGEKHPGYDCFVFPKKVYDRYNFENTCIGVASIGRSMMINLLWHAQNFQLIKDAHLTFHLGDDRSWQQEKFDDYKAYNLKQTYELIEKYTSTQTIPDYGLLKYLISQAKIDYQKIDNNIEIRDNKISKLKQLIAKKLRFWQ